MITPINPPHRQRMGQMASELTNDEMLFLRRALPHFLAGKSVREAMEAVLEDDNRLGNVIMAPDSDHGIGFNDQTYSVENTAAINSRRALSNEVYRRLRAA
jgi:hypothetical protein